MPKAVKAAKQEQMSSLLMEKRLFKPSKAFVAQANMADKNIWKKAAKNSDKYWGDWAKQLSWFKPFKSIRKGKMGDATWFLGGKLNAAYNALDRHLDGPRRYKTAILWVGEDQKNGAIPSFE